jgi:SAM-dependent methyltransferase
VAVVNISDIVVDKALIKLCLASDKTTPMHNTSELTCPICRGAATQRFISKNQRDIWGCTNIACQHLFTPPVAIDQGFHQYPLDIAAESDQALELYGERNTRLLSLLLGELDNQSPLILLDFGAGNAHISRTFKAQLQDRATIYCIEANPQCQFLYQQHGLIPLTQIQDLPQPAHLIYAIEVIEHVPDPIALLQSLGNALTDGGRIFLSTPPGHIDPQKTNAYDDVTHLHFFTPRSLNLALTQAGLKPIEYRFFPEMYPLTHPLQRWLQERLQPIGKLTRPIATRLPLPGAMGMPPSAEGSGYPYHLVGFTSR